MDQEKKMPGEVRRQQLLEILANSVQPITGTDLAEKTGVSRQVIVQDIALLRAKNESIIATPQGYMYLHHHPVRSLQRVIACRHNFEETATELYILVDHGVKIVDVTVEHPIYGEINGALMIETRDDVARFMQKINEHGASLLSSLTNGLHLHTIEATDQTKLDQACEALKIEGILLY